MKDNDPVKYKKICQLSTNLELRKEQQEFQQTEEKVSEFCSLFPDFAAPEDVLSAMCILDTNTFQVFFNGG